MHFLFSHSKSVITAIVLIVLGCAWQLPVSSDLHEWCNHGHAVSTRDSVKLKSQ